MFLAGQIKMNPHGSPKVNLSFGACDEDLRQRNQNDSQSWCCLLSVRTMSSPTTLLRSTCGPHNRRVACAGRLSNCIVKPVHWIASLSMSQSPHRPQTHPLCHLGLDSTEQVACETKQTVYKVKQGLFSTICVTVVIAVNSGKEFSRLFGRKDRRCTP